MALRHYALTFQRSRHRPSEGVPFGVIEICARGAGECVSDNLDGKGNLTPAGEFARGAISRDFDKLAFDSVPICPPSTHAVAVAGVRVSRVGIGLLHGSV